MTDIWELIAAERRRAADLVETLTPEQLGTPSLCGAWSVRDVAGHLTMPFRVGVPRLVLGIVTSGGFDRYNAKAARALGASGPAALAATLREHAGSRFTPPGLGPQAPLTDLAVHTRDIARPLGLDVTAAPDAWRTVLDFLVSPAAARSFAAKQVHDGLRLEAPDLGWGHGTGPTAIGPAEAVALVLTGRTAALADLAGDGVPVLAGRLSAR